MWKVCSAVSNLRRATARETVTDSMRRRLLQQTSNFFSLTDYIQIFCLEYKIKHIHYNVPELKKTLFKSLYDRYKSSQHRPTSQANNAVSKQDGGKLLWVYCRLQRYRNEADKQGNFLITSVHSNNINSLKCLMARYKCDTAVTPPPPPTKKGSSCCFCYSVLVVFP